MRIDAITTSLPDWYVLQTASQSGHTVVVNGHKVFPPTPPSDAQAPNTALDRAAPVGGVPIHQPQPAAGAQANGQPSGQPGDQAGTAPGGTPLTAYTFGT